MLLLQDIHLPQLLEELERDLPYSLSEITPFIIDAGVLIYSKSPDKLKALLEDPQCLDWTRSMYFRSVQWPLDFTAVVKKCGSMGGVIHYFDTHLCIFFDLGKLLQSIQDYHPDSDQPPVLRVWFLIRRRALPDGFSIGELNPQHAQQLIQDKDYRCPELDLLYYRYVLEHYPSAAIFRHGSSTAVAYICYRPEGCLGMGHVDPEHRGKGLFQVVCYELLRKLKNMGDEHTWTHVPADNLPSLRAFLGIGGVVIEGYKV